ncbi:hypothetical protein [Hyphomicrobium sp.]|uniref:hypothetical protein n=1 Tax=Hyphomicrobium sp. TaxID=82 RepID=UPI002BE7E186|nr:hypothetical protein [Hyphomicrobium sp.]HRN90007.1 hypothetical protein [Hyphomicrobium sp.]HRQ28241.1 hypothetical protein [Hyphomicrobium sp.]
MSLKKFATSAAVITALVAANLSPLAATAADARDGWHGGKRGHHYSRQYDDRRYEHRQGRSYGHKQHRRNKDRDLAKGLAIGLGVLAVGAILSSAHR